MAVVDGPRFRPRGGGAVEVVLEAGEADLLSTLPAQIRQLLDDAEGRVHERLFPRAYLDPTEEEAEREWQRISHTELLEGKLGALAVVEETLDRRAPDDAGRVRLDLSDDETAAWLSALNDVRLALGTILEVTEETDPARVSVDDPRAPGLHVYAWLTWLQGELIEALDA